MYVLNDGKFKYREIINMFYFVLDHLDVSEVFLSFFDRRVISLILFTLITDILIMCIMLVYDYGKDVYDPILPKKWIHICIPLK